MNNQPVFLCIASFFKGNALLKALKETGAIVYLVTSKKHEDKAWVREYLDEIFYVQDTNDDWAMPDVVKGLAWLMRQKKIDRVISLDDFDVEKGALLREEFRIPGMGQTTHRHFRDKLAMRVRATEQGVPNPGFSALFHDADIIQFAENNPGPWIVKPRGQASATGMKKVHDIDELWRHLDTLGDLRHEYLVEQFKPGDVFHVDSISYQGKVVFSSASGYLATPFDVAHGGGIFRSANLAHGSADEKALLALDQQVLSAFGMQYSASHTEFIKCYEDNKFYFLETASRVGGANLADMVEAATGVNLWAEWARLEYAVATNTPYKVPKSQKDYAGIVVSLTRQRGPDDSTFTDKEIVWRMRNFDYHIGLIVKSSKREKVIELLDDYAKRIKNELHASAPVPTRPKT